MLIQCSMTRPQENTPGRLHTDSGAYKTQGPRANHMMATLRKTAFVLIGICLWLNPAVRADERFDYDRGDVPVLKHLMVEIKLLAKKRGAPRPGGIIEE